MRPLWTLILIFSFTALLVWGMNDEPHTADMATFEGEWQSGIGPSLEADTRIASGPSIDGLAQAQNASVYITGEDGSCSAGVFRAAQTVFVLSAGHCVQETAKVVGSDVTLEPIFTKGGDDISMWRAVTDAGRKWLAERATGFPMEYDEALEQGTEIRCLAFRAIARGQLVMPIVSSGQTGGVLNIFKLDSNMRNWTSVTTFDGPSWPGSSGAVCYDARNQPVAMIVGGLGVAVPTGPFGSTVIPQPPTFIEGPEAFNLVRDFLRQKQ